MDLSAYTPYMLSLLRIMVGLLLLCHGTMKILGFPETDHRPRLFSIFWIAGLIELVAGALLTVGLFTQPAAFLACGFSAFAYFVGHARKDFYPVLNGGEAAVLFCFIFLYFTFAGPGPISLDALIGLFMNKAPQ